MSRKEFAAYTTGCEAVTVVAVGAPFRLRRAVLRDEFSSIAEQPLSPPQSVAYLRDPLLLSHLWALRESRAKHTDELHDRLPGPTRPTQLRLGSA